MNKTLHKYRETSLLYIMAKNCSEFCVLLIEKKLLLAMSATNYC